MNKYKYYVVTNKPDDYGSCTTELVCTAPSNAKEYYSFKAVSDEDAPILKKYIDFVDTGEETSRTDEQRFYGNE